MAAIHFAAAAAVLLIASCGCCCASDAPAAADAAAAQAAGSGGGHAQHPEEALIKWAKDRGAEVWGYDMPAVAADRYGRLGAAHRQSCACF
jgi:hypothetical protein